MIVLTLNVDIGDLDIHFNDLKAGAVLNGVNNGFAKLIGDLNN